jgi:hypothetical protein
MEETEMNALLKTAMNVTKAPRSALAEMQEGGFEYITWQNTFAGARFIARISTVEKMAKGEKINSGEVVKLGSNMNIDELNYEMNATGSDEILIKEGFSGKEITRVKKCELDAIAEVLYNKDFDCSIFWPVSDC